MSDNITLTPTPIQRNEFDVAIELAMYVARAQRLGKEEDVSDVFVRFYSLAKVLGATEPAKLIKYLPEELQNGIK